MKEAGAVVHVAALGDETAEMEAKRGEQPGGSRVVGWWVRLGCFMLVWVGFG